MPLDREPDRWNALDQAIIIARMEGSRILGLHVAADGDIGENEALQGLCADFDDRLEREGVRGNLVIEQGKPAPGIVDRARWSDLVIFDLKFPPRFRSIRRLGSGSRHLIQRSPRPLLAVRGKPTPIKRALLAFDGSLKSREALYVAAYLAGRHGVRLRVLTVGEPNKKRQRALEEARTYLEAQGVEAEYRLQTGPLASTILSEVSQSKTDHILMGGYGASPVLGIVLGSAVDQILRDSHVPMLIST